MNLQPPTVGLEESDSELVSRCLAGEREAFSRIVARYQTLICSLAYSRIGNLGQSEDIAQETFIAAWRHLRLLREPTKLRAWLCGIVRNRVNKTLRREGRDPVNNAGSLDLLRDSNSGEALPSERAITREEEAILWRSIERIPELYRDPLILFYRHHQSIQAVAAELQLTDDAVKKRLSRGRRLLHEEVQAFIENSLRRTAPSPGFSKAVLAALPAHPKAAAGITIAAKGSAATQLGFITAWLMPLLGTIGGMAAHWLIVREAPTARERRIKTAAFAGVWMFILIWCIPGTFAMRALSRHLHWSDAVWFRFMAGFWWVYAMILASVSTLLFGFVATLRSRNETPPEPCKTPPERSGRLEGLALVGGIHLGYFGWLIALAFGAHDGPFGWLLSGVMLVLVALNHVKLGNTAGAAATRIVARHHALLWAVILLVLNSRLSLWLAAIHHIQPEALQELLPWWSVLALTIALVGWVAILLRVARSHWKWGAASSQHQAGGPRAQGRGTTAREA